MLNASRVGRHAQDALHLRVADVQYLLGHEEADALLARRNGQATHVGPEVFKVTNLTHGLVEVLSDVGQLSGLVEADEPWPLGDKLGVGIPGRIDAHGQDTDIVALRVRVHEMDLGPASSPVDRMLARSVSVPPDHVASDPVESDVGKTAHRLFVIVGCKGRAVSPVEVIPRHVLSIVAKG